MYEVRTKNELIVTSYSIARRAVQSLTEITANSVLKIDTQVLDNEDKYYSH